MVSFCLVSSLFTPPVRILRKGRLYSLGRDPACDFPLPSDVVSRRHAEIEWAPKGGFQIRDLRSKNGTLVNGERVEDVLPLKDGDKLWLGPFSLQFREYQGDISDLLSSAPSDADQTLALSREVMVAQQPSASFAGKFAGQELLDICHLMALNEKDGTLLVFGEKRHGRIHFQKGWIVHAQAGADMREDEQAALALLSLATGRFEFIGGRVAQANARIQTASVIMEAARRRDEGAETARMDGPREGPL
jgi:pSer/pThr/pTyr-binding forkhead associated (FHA) protein